MKVIVFLTGVFIFISCKTEKIYHKNADFKYFSMDIPLDWHFIKQKGIDSEVYYLITHKKDTILVEIGRYSILLDDIISVDNLKDYDMLESNNFSVREMFFSDTPEIDENQGVFHKEYYYYDTINNKVAKFRVPKKIGKGRTSIHFSNLQDDKTMTINAKNLDSMNQCELIKAFYSIVFKI